MFLDYYKALLGPIPNFLDKYLQVPTLKRLKKVSYFCGMTYASKEIYQFKENISRFDHSLTTALLTYRLTHDKISTLAALFHDVATPCFSHAIDYMNGDYAKQESTEANTALILQSDWQLQKLLAMDNIPLTAIINYKQYSIVDNERPKVCADRLDGLILTGYAWTKDLNLYDIFLIINNLKVMDIKGKVEIGFASAVIAEKVWTTSENIDQFCHSREDNYMMQLLANITQLGLNLGLYRYENLFTYNEEELMQILNSCQDGQMQNLLKQFTQIKIEEIDDIALPYIKKRSLNPLVNGQRLL